MNLGYQQVTDVFFDIFKKPVISGKTGTRKFLIDEIQVQDL
jgi:hypothetical protein